MKLTNRHRHPWALIEKAVLLSKKEKLTYRDISDKISNLGIYVSHKTIFEWVQKFSTNVKIKKFKREEYYNIDVSEVRCNGKNMFMYQAFDSKKNTVGVFFRPKKNINIAKKHFLNIIKEGN